MEYILTLVFTSIGLLADGNIHNIKLIQRYISNNGNPVKAQLTLYRVYSGNSSDIKGNSRGTKVAYRAKTHIYILHPKGIRLEFCILIV